MLLLVVCLVVVSCACGADIRRLHVRLAAENDDVRLAVRKGNANKQLANPSINRKVADNRSIALKRAKGEGNNTQGHPEPIASDSLTCMRWTGGTCKVLSCRSERGPDTICERGYCVCKPGSCADAEGKCIPNFEGDWIGEYSIRFDKPFLPEKPFLGFAEGSGAAESWSGVSGAIAWLATVSTNDKQWKIAQTPNGRVRLANTKHPGSVLAIYNNRRRSDFMQRQAQNQEKKIKDDDDLWPVLKKLEAATPLEATFQIRPTMKNGGGYELWDPANQVSLASADPDSWGDSVVENGVTECYHKSFFTSDPCDGGKQLIVLEPTLPNDALLKATRSNIEAISIIPFWQVCLMICCGSFCCFCIATDENNPNSKPVIYDVFHAARTAVHARAEAQAQHAREENDFAEKIVGEWILESDIGIFEYSFFLGESGGISLRGRAQGAPEWDRDFAGKSLPSSNRLNWEDDSGTKFEIKFEDQIWAKECSGTATSVGGQEVSFIGKRVEHMA